MRGTIRSFEPDVRRTIRREMERIARGVTKAHGARFELEHQDMYPATVNHPKITDLVRAAAADVVGKRNVIELEPTTGSEDMSYVLQKVPGTYIAVGSANEKKGLATPHHAGDFDFDEAVLPIGIELFVRTSEQFLGRDGRR
jgi:amidohydrolase